MKMDGGRKKRNVVQIKPFRAPGVIDISDDQKSPEPHSVTKKPNRQGAGDAAASGLSESTPKRNSAFAATDAVNTPKDRPVVLEEEFSPIELFPFSQSQSVPIVQWNYNAGQRARTGSLRRSRPSSGSVPSPPEIKAPKRRTPSPTVEDMPPPKKSSQEVVSTFQERLLQLQAMISNESDEEELNISRPKETEEEKLGTSMHMNLHISDKFEISAASPDLFDSAPDVFMPINEPSEPTPPASNASLPTGSAPVPSLPAATLSSKPEVPSANSTPSTVPKTQLTPQDMSFDDDFDESLLLEIVEKAEMRLSQQQQQKKDQKDPPQEEASKNRPVKKNSSKKAGKDLNNSFQRGRLQVVTVTSPSKQTPTPTFVKKPVAVAGPSRKSDGMEFSPKWMENIKKSSSPMNSSIRASQSTEKNFHRSLFDSGKKNEDQSKSSPVSEKAQAALNKTFDPFEDSFDTNFEELDAVEALAMSQKVATQKADPVPPAKPNVILKPRPPRPPPSRYKLTAQIQSRPAPAPTSTFQRHQSAPTLNKPIARPQLPVSKPLAQPPQINRPQPQINQRPPQQGFKPQASVPKPQVPAARPQAPAAKVPPPRPLAPQQQNFKPQAAAPKPVQPKPAAPVARPNIPGRSATGSNPFGSDPSSVKQPVINNLKASPFVRHRSADVLNNKQQPVASAAPARLSGSPLLRHRSADFGQVQPGSQKCTKEDIERKRLDALRRMEERNRKKQLTPNT